MKPLSSMCLTKKPISSMWAAIMALGAPSFAALLTAVRLPMASTLSSSTTPSSSRSMSSRTRSSRPGTPGVSESRLSSSICESLPPGRQPVGDDRGQPLRALLLYGVAALRHQYERGVRQLGGELLGLRGRHHAVLCARHDQRRDSQLA